MKFRQLAGFFEKMSGTASRLSITQLLAELLTKLEYKEVKKTIYLLQGRIGPSYQGIEFGMAEKTVVKSSILALNIEKRLFNRENNNRGDTGKTVEYFKGQIKSFDEKDLTILEVFDQLYLMATTSGDGSQDIKAKLLSNLIRQLDPLSCKFLVRIPVGALRLGFSDMTVLDALSWSVKGNKSLRPLIEKAYHVRPDLGFIAEIIKKRDLEGLGNVKPEIFTPIIMMRAERLSSGTEIISKIGKCAIEPKYDGFRLQVHCKKFEIRNSKFEIKVRLYSRNLDDVTYMYPDIVEGVKKEIKAEELIFEGEAIGFDPHTGIFLPFQETVQRKRKYGITEMAKEIPLKLFAFEILYKNGINYLQIPYIGRRKELEKSIRLTGDLFKDTLLLAPENLVDDPKKLEILFADALTKGLEGIIAKKLNGIYQPGARGWNWIKFKRSYSSKIEDTIDCLVMGYDFGKGKRTKFGLGAFLVGIYDEKEDKFVSVAKIGTGLTDIEWKNLKSQMSNIKSQNKPNQYNVDNLMKCDVWVVPKVVVEIKADEITRSPVHTAGRIMKASKSGGAFEVDIPGYALRFPRLERFRDDKRPDDITTLKEFEEMFKAQEKA